ncbi:hypothetical protein [Novosphingobium naphthalenivorans]|uniref:hypothetical protein n=1 Tax=Novosphingobium naphthalenivorans TaxID=273168 RepID=UPI0008355019|nr:hypothetical protein [Novosphingobium naphthalenivorans]
MSKLLAAVAASSLLATPALANTAAPLSVAKVASVKASTSAKKSNKLTPGVIVGVLAGAAVIGGVIAIADDNNSSSN